MNDASLMRATGLWMKTSGKTGKPYFTGRLRALAARVRHLGTAGRADPEAVVVEKLAIAVELAQLVRRLEAATP